MLSIHDLVVGFTKPWLKFQQGTHKKERNENFIRVLQTHKQRDEATALRAHYHFFSYTLSHHTSIPFYKVKLQELLFFVMTLCFITKNSKMWKTQKHKCYRMTIDTNTYGKTKDTNCYEISRGTFWFTTSNISYTINFEAKIKVE